MISKYFEYVIGEEFCSKVTDGTHDTPKQVKNGKHLITSKHIKGDEIDFDSAYLISESDFNAINKRSKVDQWDVIISMIGAYCGFCFLESNSEIDYAVKNVGLFKNRSEINAKWLYYYLNSPVGQAHLNAARSGSTQPYISLGSLRELPILVPKEESRKKSIVNVLEVLDSKLRINNNISTELESMAKTLYDYWFLQFDFPDAEGKPYKVSGGKMVYNEVLKREIPEGWEVKPVSEIIEVRDGTHDSPKPSEKGEYLITSKHLQPSGIDFSNAYFISYEDFEAVNKRSKVDEGDFLISMIGTIGLSQWVMKITTPFAIKNIGLLKTSQSPEYADYIFASVTSSYGKAYLQQNQSIGTSQPYITLGTLRGIPIIIPSKKVFDEFNRKVKPIHKLLYKNATESQKLVELRDWLLPMLMNGQVTIN